MREKMMWIFLMWLPLTAAAGPHKVIDVGAQSTDGTTYQVLLCSRMSPDKPRKIPGHAFVGFSRTLPGGRRDFIALGHSTSASVGDTLLTYLGVKSAVPGYISAEHYTDVSEECLVINTSQALFESAYGIAAGIYATLGIPLQPRDRLPRNYALGEDDCMKMMIDVAGVFAPAVNVPTRGRTELPRAYLRRLIESN